MYAYKYVCVDGDDGEEKRAKGICKGIVDKTINFNHYMETLTNQTIQVVKQRNLCSKHHAISSVEVAKLAFTPLDLKRYILDDGIHSFAYGHYETLS